MAVLKMPSLKADERMQACEFEEHSDYKLQKYYIVRSYGTELERHFCFGCLQVMSRLGHVRYDTGKGWVPIHSDEETLLNIYGVKGFYKTNTPPKVVYNKEAKKYTVVFAGVESEPFDDSTELHEYIKSLNWTKHVKV